MKKKLLSILCVLALAITAIVSLAPAEQTQAAIKKKLYPQIEAVNCKATKKKVYVGKNLYDCVNNTYFESRKNSGSVKISKIEDNAYLAITAPEDGLLFIQLTQAENENDYIVGTTTNKEVKQQITKLADLTDVKNIAFGYIPLAKKAPSIVGSLAKANALCEYTMAKDEVLYLHINCTNKATLKLAWIGTDSLIEVSDYDSEIDFKINTGVEITNTKDVQFNEENVNLASLKFYFDLGTSNRFSLNNNGRSITISNDTTKKSNIQTHFITKLVGVNAGKSCITSIQLNIPILETEVPVIFKTYWPDIMKYNSSYISKNAPAHPLFMEAKTKVIYGYDSTKSNIVITYNKKSFTVTPDSNGYYCLTLKSSLSKNKTVDMYYENKGEDFKVSYVVAPPTEPDTSSASTKSVTIEKPIMCQKGTNIIIGKVNATTPTKLNVKIGKKEYVAVTDKSGLYCVVLKSSLKTKDKILIYTDGMEESAQSFDVQIP